MDTITKKSVSLTPYTKNGIHIYYNDGKFFHLKRLQTKPKVIEAVVHDNLLLINMLSMPALNLLCNMAWTEFSLAYDYVGLDISTKKTEVTTPMYKIASHKECT